MRLDLDPRLFPPGVRIYILIILARSPRLISSRFIIWRYWRLSFTVAYRLSHFTLSLFPPSLLHFPHSSSFLRFRITRYVVRHVSIRNHPLRYWLRPWYPRSRPCLRVRTVRAAQTSALLSRRFSIPSRRLPFPRPCEDHP